MVCVLQPMDCLVTEDSQLTIDANRFSSLPICELLQHFINNIRMGRPSHWLFEDALDVDISRLEETCQSCRNKVHNNVLMVLTKSWIPWSNALTSNQFATLIAALAVARVAPGFCCSMEPGFDLQSYALFLELTSRFASLRTRTERQLQSPLCSFLPSLTEAKFVCSLCRSLEKGGECHYCLRRPWR